MDGLTSNKVMCKSDSDSRVLDLVVILSTVHTAHDSRLLSLDKFTCSGSVSGTRFGSIHSAVP
jgi:hypothetical protein